MHARPCVQGFTEQLPAAPARMFVDVLLHEECVFAWVPVVSWPCIDTKPEADTKRATRSVC